MRDDDSGRRTGRPGRVLQIRGSRPTFALGAGLFPAVQNQANRHRRPTGRIHRRANRHTVLTLPTTEDVVRMTAGDVSRSTAKEPGSSAGPRPGGSESGTATSPACSAPRNAATYSRPVWCQYHRAVTGSIHGLAERLVNTEKHSPIKLRPRQAFGKSFPILFVINKCERRVIGLQTGALAQHRQNRRFGHRHSFTLRLNLLGCQCIAEALRHPLHR